jgi:hypothetical protein
MAAMAAPDEDQASKTGSGLDLPLGAYEQK